MSIKEPSGSALLPFPALDLGGSADKGASSCSFHVGLQLFKGPLVNDEHFMATDTSTGELQPLLDPSRTYYYGNSQGAILGGAYSALSNDIERAALGVGGGPYHLLLTRSKDFDPFFTLFETMYPDPAEVGLWLGLLQTLCPPSSATP